MNTSHHLAKVTYASITPSKVSGTNKWKTALDQNEEQEENEKEFDHFPLYVHQPEPKNFKKINKKINIKVFEDNRKEKTNEFYNRLKELKEQQEKTMQLIKNLAQSENIDSNRRVIEKEEADRTKQVQFVDEKRKEIVEEDLTTSIFEQLKQKAPIRSVDEILKRMWDNFDYDMQNVIAEEEEEKAKKKAIKCEKWKPIVTVPKPFQMTIREEKKKSLKEKLNKSAKTKEDEQVDYVHRHRAKSAPATTFIPLFEEIQETQVQRSRENKNNALIATAMIQSPFSFDKRDKWKKEEKEEEILKKKKQEIKESKEMSRFRATPLNRKIFDSAVYDRLEEEELYRKIKGRIRNEELFFSSTLPPRMQKNREKEARKRQEKMTSLRKEQEFTFRPELTRMPDFDRLHRKEAIRKLQFEEEQERKRRIEQKPFRLSNGGKCKQVRASSVSSTSSSSCNEKQDNVIVRPSSSRSFRLTRETSNPFPTRMSESSRMRMEKIRTSLDAAQKQLDEYRKVEEERKKKQKKLKQQLSYNISVIDASKDPDFEERTEKNKNELRQRQKEYQRFLKEVQHRVDHRPLLVDLHDRNLVESQAEKRYQEIISKSSKQQRWKREESGTADDFAGNHVESDHETISITNDQATKQQETIEREEEDETASKLQDADETTANQQDEIEDSTFEPVTAEVEDESEEIKTEKIAESESDSGEELADTKQNEDDDDDNDDVEDNNDEVAEEKHVEFA